MIHSQLRKRADHVELVAGDQPPWKFDVGGDGSGQVLATFRASSRGSATAHPSPSTSDAAVARIRAPCLGSLTL